MPKRNTLTGDPLARYTVEFPPRAPIFVPTIMVKETACLVALIVRKLPNELVAMLAELVPVAAPNMITLENRAVPVAVPSDVG